MRKRRPRGGKLRKVEGGQEAGTHWRLVLVAMCSWMVPAAIGVLWLLPGNVAIAGTLIEGVVVAIHDGDTVTVLD